MNYSLPEPRLENRFMDKKPPYNRGDALSEAHRCLYCHDAPCIQACPTFIDIPTFIRKIATANVRGAARTILSSNLLGASCARVCPVEVLCEGACVYVGWGRQAIAIGRLQRYAMDNGATPDLLVKSAATGSSVGLVGAGPASLACAGTLALLGHQAVIYERGALPGGLNTTGVAPYKMEATGALNEVRFIQKLGVEVRTGVEVGRDVSVQELLEQHDALFLGPGLGKDSHLGISQEQGAGVVGAVEWIHRMKTDSQLCLNGVHCAAVIGGGNTALDAARELAQLGTPEVRLIYRRAEDKMRGYRHEWEQAKKEGVVLIPEAGVGEIIRKNGHVQALKLMRVKDGQLSDEVLQVLPVELVITAIGQARLRKFVSLFPGVSLDARDCIVADPETGATGNPRIFAGGDARNGGKEVVNAVYEGQVAARSIDSMLRKRKGE